MQKGPPAKVLWYLSITPQLKHCLAMLRMQKNLTWHANGRKCD